MVLARNWQFFGVAGKFCYKRKKNRYSRLSGGCAIIITTGKKKVPVVCLAGARSLLRPEKKFVTTRKKKVPVVCLAGVSVFGSGGKLAVFLLWRENFITTGKKKIQSSVWRVRDHYYDRKKKRYSRLSGGLCCCISFWFWWEIGNLIHFEH